MDKFPRIGSQLLGSLVPVVAVQLQHRCRALALVAVKVISPQTPGIPKVVSDGELIQRDQT